MTFSTKASVWSTLFIAAGLLWLLSQIWVILLAAALVGLCGWTAVMLIRTTTSGTAGQLSPASAPALTLVPDTEYRPLQEVDLAVFSTPESAAQAATHIFEAWIGQQPQAPASAADLIRAKVLHTRHIGRLITEVAQRELLQHTRPVAAKTQLLAPRLSMEAAAYSTASADEIRARSVAVVRCEPCNGSGKQTCVQCEGTKTLTCPGCQGSGKAHAYAKNGSYRLMNCKECGRKGTLPCKQCSGGVITCLTCRGSGLVETWIEVAEKVRYDTQVEPDGEVTRAFRWGADGVAATREEVEEDAKIIVELSAEGPVSFDEVARQVPADWLQGNWDRLQPRLASHERVRRQTLWCLEVPRVEITYAVGGGPLTSIYLEGRRLLAPPPAQEQQLVKRAALLSRLRYLLPGLAVVLSGGYALRGWYFVSGRLVAISALISAVCFITYQLIASYTIHRQRARPWAPGLIAATALLGAVVVWSEPSVAAFRRHLDHQEFAAASALLDTMGPGSPVAATLQTELQVATLLASTDRPAVIKGLSLLLPPSPQRGPVLEHALLLSERDAEQELQHGAPETALAVLLPLTPALRGDAMAAHSARFAELRAQIEEARAKACADPLCRLDRAKEALAHATSAARQQRLEAARAEVKGALNLEAAPAEQTAERFALLRRTESLAAGLVDDPLLGVQARAARAAIAEELRRFRLLGAPNALATALLGTAAGKVAVAPAGPDPGVLLRWKSVGGRCAGLYLVGASRGDRTLSSTAHAAHTNRLLAQVFGHPVDLPGAPAARSARDEVKSARWRADGIAMEGRWDNGELTELRIGDGEP